MTLNISSERLCNPLLVSLLRNLSRIFADPGYKFWVIGATARDLNLLLLANSTANRKTRDLDIAIAINCWKSFDTVTEALVNQGFKKSVHQKQRFYFENYEIDIVPFGDVARDNQNIYWPPEYVSAMSVRAFDVVINNPVSVCLDNEFTFNIVSLAGLFILKLNAWEDRSLLTNKDAEDLWYIIDSYYFANENRGYHDEVYAVENFDITIAGACWLAHDIADMLGAGRLEHYFKLLKSETGKGDESRLISQIITTQRNLSFDKILAVLKTIIDVFSQRM